MKIDKKLQDYIDKVLTVCSARAKFVIEHILKYGSISSEHIRNAGYVHGARAIGDVRDNGLPLRTNTIKSTDGRNIAEYTFGDASQIKKHKFGGRIAFPKSLKNKLLERDGSKCMISKQSLPESELQVDHKVPYFITGDIHKKRNPNDFMLLSKSMQRAKSWSCEHCKNLLEGFEKDVCKSCYWASPNDYSHMATKALRSVNVTWEGDEVRDYDRMKIACQKMNKTVQETLKILTKENFQSRFSSLNCW